MSIERRTRALSELGAIEPSALNGIDEALKAIVAVTVADLPKGTPPTVPDLIQTADAYHHMLCHLIRIGHAHALVGMLDR